MSPSSCWTSRSELRCAAAIRHVAGSELTIQDLIAIPSRMPPLRGCMQHWYRFFNLDRCQERRRMSLDVAASDRPGRALPGADLAERLALSAAHRPDGTALLESWLNGCRRRSPFRVERVPLKAIEGWRFAPESGDLVHDSGRFFSVRGIHVKTDYGCVPEWSQPILDQPDRAILGILAREIDGVLHFLMQAKMEPGNANTVQISPTVQATPSNYLRAHKGRCAPYVEYFAEPGHGRVLVDVLQSEQGSWFRGKRNRNMLMEVTRDVEHHDDFAWLTLGEIHALLRLPNV